MHDDNSAADAGSPLPPYVGMAHTGRMEVAVYNERRVGRGGRIKIADNYGGHNAANYGGHPAPAGRALPNLLMRSKC